MKEYDSLMIDANIKNSDNFKIGHNSNHAEFLNVEKIKENKTRTKPLFKNIEINIKEEPS